jgi:hypothetical protein
MGGGGVIRQWGWRVLGSGAGIFSLSLRKGKNVACVQRGEKVIWRMLPQLEEDTFLVYVQKI